MSSIDELNADIAALKQKIAANEAKVDAGTLADAKEVAIRQQIASDTALLTTLITERGRLQQQQQAGEVCSCLINSSLLCFLREMCSVRKSLTCLF
jgi:hypothetical protein